MRRSHAVRAAVVAAALLGALAAPAGADDDDGRAPATPGAAGLGDRLFLGLGNGGYDVLHYDLSLRYETAAPTEAVVGTIRVVSRATQALSRFNLDFAGGAVGDVHVNGREATWVRDGEELVVTPPRALREGQVFSTRVRGFTATPTVPGQAVESTAFFSTPDGTATAPQPNVAHFLYPSNDHPRDKARFTFRLDVPDGTTAVANGVLTHTARDGDGRTTWRYRQRQPMATELTQVAVGAFDVTQRGVQDGVSLRDVTPRRLTAELAPKLAAVLDHLPWMRERVGDPPFETYGSLVVDQPLGFALETQTLSIYDTPWFDLPRGVWDPVMLHELSHQWFGNSVSPYEWSDLWLNEGHATWYELTYAEDRGLLAQNTAGAFGREEGFAQLEALMRQVHAAGDAFRSAWGPVAQPVSGETGDLFSPNVYFGGALVLFALREEIGVEAFERLERRWVQRFRGRSVSTADFVALASEVAGRDLTAFLRAWLYGTTTPPMPNHPDWTVGSAQQPATEAAATEAAAAEGLASR